MKRKIVGLTSLFATACSPQKEVQKPEVLEIKIAGPRTEIEEIVQGQNPFMETEYVAKHCEKIDLQDGIYVIEFNKWGRKYYHLSTYTDFTGREEKRCTLYFVNNMLSYLSDVNCDGSVDEWVIFPSSDTSLAVQRSAKEELFAKDLDPVFQDGLHFICPENRGESINILFNEALKKYQ